ncbi:MAG: DEAD/DEAH box helicase [Acidiferrobacterales bacterium]
MSFIELNLNSKLLKAIEASGFTTPTDIQIQAIPVVLAGRDLMASAQTGTGKTAAFVLPALQRLLDRTPAHGRGPRVLVLTPTRELAMQVNDNIRQFGRFCQFTAGSVVGGMPYPPQMRMLRQPLDLLVATPGRLMDHMEQGRVDFSRLEILVLDEADRMLDMGFVDAIKTIVAATPATRQTLLFSATLEGRVLATAKQVLKDPARVQLAANSEQHASIQQRVHQADNPAHKHNLLAHYIDSDSVIQALIFTATKRGADKLAKTLTAKGHPSAALHGDMGQSQRKRTVDRVRDGQVRLLVATDVAARGLDIRGISHVINFDLPMVAEDYIHRIGRTGRGGDTGTAITFVGPEDRAKLAGIERLVGRKLEREVIPGLEPLLPEQRANHNSKNRGKPQGRRNAAAPRRSKPWSGAPTHSASRPDHQDARRSEGNVRQRSNERNSSSQRRRPRSAPSLG